MTLEYTGTSTAATSLDRIWEALDRGGFKPQKRANTFKALCPIHADAQPSLSVKYDSVAGKVVLHCFGCGDASSAADITAALGMTVSDLFDAPLPADRRSSSRSQRPRTPKVPTRITRDELATSGPDLTDASWSQTKVYEYVDDNGVVQQRVHREETTVDGQRHKRFTQSYRGAGGRTVKRKPADYTPLLYNLRNVREAVAAGGDVWLLEGEKDADSAISEGLVGTTNAGGATAFPVELLEQFRGGRVNVVVDNDAAGAKRAETVGAQLADLGIPARLFLPAVTERKGDFTDHLDAGGSTDTLVEISVNDAHALVSADEADKLVHGRTGLGVCVKEATAQLEEKHQDRATSEQHAEAWARESLNRFEKLRAIGATLTSKDALSGRGQAAVDEYRALLLEGAQLASDTYGIAGLDVPQVVASAIAALTPIRAEQPEHDAEFIVDSPSTSTGSGRGGAGGVFFGNNADGDEEPKPRAFIHGVRYRVEDEQTVLVKMVPDGNGKSVERLERILNGTAELLAVAIEDDGTDSEVARAPHMYTIRFTRKPRDERGRPQRNKETGEEIVESVVMKYSADQIRDGSWAQAQPWPGFLESNSRRGRDQAWDAILKAITPPSTNSVIHTTVGWRDSDTGPYFIHAHGAIAKGGTIGADVDVDKTSAIYAMPTPTLDRDELRKAWEDGTLSLRESELPARVVAPLLGHAWTAPLLPGPIILHLVGGYASYKSSHSRLAVQYFAPDLTYTTKGLISGAAGGATAIGLQRTLSSISHVPVIVDDFAPDGDAKGAIRRISSLGRTIFNGIGRIKAKQRGGTESDRPILASVITSGELSAQGSADSRIVNLPLDPATVVNGGEIFGRLESRRNRHARAQLGSALVQWIAGRRAELVAAFEQAEEDIDHDLCTQKYWRETIPKVSTHAGLHDRLVQSAVVLDRGVAIMMMLLQDLEVIDQAEATSFYTWARKGILDAIMLQDASASDPAEQLLGYLREALGNGSAHLAGPNGSPPANAESLGWTNQSGGMHPQWRGNGQCIGAIKGDRIFLLPGTVIGIANRMSFNADEAFSETKVSISSSLQSHGWLVSDAEGKRSVNRRVGGVQQRVWDIPATALLGSNDDGKDPGAAAAGDDYPDDGFPPPSYDDAPPPPDTTAPDAGAEAIPTLDIPDNTTPVPEQSAPTAPASAAAEATATAPTTTATAPGEFRAPLGVLDTEGLWLSNGELIRIRGQLEHAGQLARLAHDMQLGTQINTGANKLRKTERGQIYLTREAALSLGLAIDDLVAPTDSDFPGQLRDATKGSPFLTMAVEEGYSMTGDGAMRASIDVWREDDRSMAVHIALIPAQGDAFIRTILHGDPDAATIARRLGKFTSALRFPYRSSAGTTGIKLMTALVARERHEQVFRPVDKPTAVKDNMIAEGDYNWQRALTEQEQSKPWVHGFDRGGSYLAATSVEVGIGEATHHEGPLQFTRANRLPGYWSITVPELGGWQMPDLFALQGRTGEGLVGSKIWVTTPTMELADELGIELEIHEAYLWHEKGRVFDGWYNRMRDARTQLDTDDVDDQLARDLIKRTYVAAIGMLDFRGDHDTLAVWAPHRHDMIVAKSRANIIRRIRDNANRTGLWPVAVEKDTIVYVTDVEDGASAWPGDPKFFGRGLGQYKYEGSDTTAHHLEFLTGKGPYKGKEHLDELI